MTRETAFDPLADLIYVETHVFGPRGAAPAVFILDTGAEKTLIVPDLVDQLGYSPRDGLRMTSVSTALGRENGYLLRLSRFHALGFTLLEFPVNVLDLADRAGFDGLIGLNFLRRFNYQVRSKEGRILLENLAPLAA